MNKSEFLKALSKQLKLLPQEDREYKVMLTDAAKDKVIAEGYNPNYGARPLKRYVQKTVETLAAKLILSGNVSEGDTITIDVEDGKFTAR